MSARTPRPLTAGAAAALLSFGLAGGIALDRLVLSSRGHVPDSGGHSALAQDPSATTGRGAEPTSPRVIPHQGLGRNPGSAEEADEEPSDAPTDQRQDGFPTVADRLLAEPPSERRRDQIRELAHAWARHDPRAALEWAADELAGIDRHAATEAIFDRWVGDDPAAAAGFLGTLPKSERNLDMLHHAVREWAERDRHGALDWAQSLADSTLSARALHGAVAGWAGHEPGAAADFALALPDGFQRQRALEEVAHQWVARDPDAALEWTRALAGRELEAALGAVVHTIADHDPRRAAEVYHEMTTRPEDTGLETDRVRHHLARELADRWAGSDPQAAARWALTLPAEDDVRRGAVREVAAHWSRVDSRAASEWIAAMEPGDTRDAAAGVLVEHTAHIDPQAAFAWAATIEHPDSRGELMHHTLTAWHETDPAAARRALLETGWPADHEWQRRLRDIVAPEAPASHAGQSSQPHDQQADPENADND